MESVVGSTSASRKHFCFASYFKADGPDQISSSRIGSKQTRGVIERFRIMRRDWLAVQKADIGHQCVFWCTCVLERIGNYVQTHSQSRAEINQSHFKVTVLPYNEMSGANSAQTSNLSKSCFRAGYSIKQPAKSKPKRWCVVFEAGMCAQHKFSMTKNKLQDLKLMCFMGICICVLKEGRFTQLVSCRASTACERRV